MTREKRKAKFGKQGGLCHWCRCPMSLEPLNENGKPNNLYATAEHVQPRAHGGLGKPNNIVLAHASCNRKRGSQPTHKFTKHVDGMRKNFAAGLPIDEPQTPTFGGGLVASAGDDSPCSPFAVLRR